MKMKFGLTFLLLMAITYARCDDGAFFASGNTLFPLQETSIELKKEYLNLTFNDQSILGVDILFEFYNPGEDKEILVGFVTPPADGVIPEKEILNHPQISDFKVLIGHNLLHYEVNRVDSTSFNVLNGNASGDDFIYYFKVKFKHGLTNIQHSYNYKGGISTDAISRFEYRLTTGKNWANKQIDEFNINIYFGKNKYFEIPANLEGDKLIEWNLYGVGRLSNSIKNQYIEGYFLSGGINAVITNFKPQYDLNINLKIPEQEYLKEHKYPYYDHNFDSLSNDELWKMKNSYFATKGYKFENKVLYEYFLNYVWYIPDPNIINDNGLITDYEKRDFDSIVNEINKRSN
jgi:YARHG domain